ncbi:unnamed protein product [Paramecium pentaurelia]|uniref:Uncharacterized protein n=1 Tax=Paramecium pentaurelia TaxID=43138 RepID=A0A8S1WGZ7_9CILI|nr:unnamed protein product [Paramecium pentaurelia]
MNVPEEYLYIIYCLDNQFTQTYEIRIFKSQRMDNLTFFWMQIFKNSQTQLNLQVQKSKLDCPSEVEIARYLLINSQFILLTFILLIQQNLYPNNKIQLQNIPLSYPNISKYIKVYQQYSVTTSEQNHIYFQLLIIEYQYTTMVQFY